MASGLTEKGSLNRSASSARTRAGSTTSRQPRSRPCCCRRIRRHRQDFLAARRPLVLDLLRAVASFTFQIRFSAPSDELRRLARTFARGEHLDVLTRSGSGSPAGCTPASLILRSPRRCGCGAGAAYDVALSQLYRLGFNLLRPSCRRSRNSMASNRCSIARCVTSTARAAAPMLGNAAG